MLYVPGRLGKDLCDSQLGMTRRDIVRVGATSLFGLNLGQILEMQAHGAAKDLTGGQAGKPNDANHGGGPGWDRPNPLCLSTYKAARRTSTSGTPKRTFPTT